jgi:MoxR-like ATPase
VVAASSTGHLDLSSPGALAGQLATQAYLADTGVATAVVLAGSLGRPLFLEGAPGVGKTSLATAVAAAAGLPLIRLQCYEGLDSATALYDWDFARQLMHLRARENDTPAEALENSLYERRFLVARPLLQAVENSPCVLLIDEVDRADHEFEAFLLELLSDFAVTVPELGTIHADPVPLVFLTSNRTRDVHDALKRRCLYHWLDHPDRAAELAILRTRLPELDAGLADQIATAVAQLRALALLKPPGVGETLDFAAALLALGTRTLDTAAAAPVLGTLLKYHEDVELARTTSWPAAVS